MKTKDGRKIIEQIQSVRSRLRFEHREAELFARLGAIESSYEGAKQGASELLRYYPTALVACVESYFRLAIKELIDSGEPYLSNSRQLLQRVGYDFDILVGLHGKTITIGEVISQHPSISSLGHVIATMDTVMGKDFRGEVATVCERWDVEVHKGPTQPIISNRDETFGHVDRTFRLRHILCHETATAIEIEREAIDNCIRHTSVFLRASDELIAQTLFPDAPLTQADMNQASYADYEREKVGMDALIQSISVVLSSKQNAQFVVANKAWQKLFKASVDIEALAYEGGSIMPTIANLASVQLVRDRKVQLERLLDFLQEDA